MKLVYASKARDDLIRLRAFIAEKNPRAAQRIGRRLIEKILHLKDFPLLGVEVERAPEPKQIRDLILDRYVIRYLVTDTTLHILRIWHQKEEREALEEDDRRQSRGEAAAPTGD